MDHIVKYGERKNDRCKLKTKLMSLLYNTSAVLWNYNRDLRFRIQEDIVFLFGDELCVFMSTQKLVWINLIDHVTKRILSFPFRYCYLYVLHRLRFGFRYVRLGLSYEISMWVLVALAGPKTTSRLKGVQCPRPAVTRSYVISLKYNLDLSWSRLHFLTLLGFQVSRVLMRGAKR